jgi:formate--tetrahydrofolate ligase
MHGGIGTVRPGRPLPKELIEENLPALEKGGENLVKHIENARLFGVPVVVAVNRFTQDTEPEIELIQKMAVGAGAEGAYVSEVWAHGGKGGTELAQAVIAACQKPTDFRLLYPDDLPIKQKIETIATKVYGADGVDYDAVAERKIEAFTKWGLDKLPICMAKTHLSLSHDSNLKGRPRGFRVPVRDIRPSAGAGFLYPLCGAFTTMPGLPSRPAAVVVDVDKDGKIVGLF